MQYVSSTPATRLDIIGLQERLDQQLQQRQVRTADGSAWLPAPISARCGLIGPNPAACYTNLLGSHLLQARETGICPVREELYAQCFDELIRQVTINCAERGLLLLRVRDELRMTIAAYPVSSLSCLSGLQQPVLVRACDANVRNPGTRSVTRTTLPFPACSFLHLVLRPTCRPCMRARWRLACARRC